MFRSTALNLQEKAEAVYQREREFRERHPPSLSAGSNRRSSFAPTSPGETYFACCDDEKKEGFAELTLPHHI